MISSQLLQKALDDIKNLTGKCLAVVDSDGHVAAATFENKQFDVSKIAAFISVGKEQDKDKIYTYFKIKEDGQDSYILAVAGTDEPAEMVGIMAKYQIETLIAAYKEKFDKDNFFKSLLMDNMMLVDIYDRSKRLHIELEEKRVVYIVQLQKKNQDDAIDIIRNLFVNEKESFCAAMSQHTVIIIKSVSEKDNSSTLEAIAKRIYSVLKSDIKEEPYISYGTVVNELKDVSKSYREAKMALEVGRIFFAERQINSYSNLGIGRLIYQLPTPLCKMYLKEIFDDLSIDDFDEETLTTINKFFENSLNVSETSRQLYIHRNTLVYRLDKIQKLTGLDLRVFDDAITFKIALMVSKYMAYMESQEPKI